MSNCEKHVTEAAESTQEITKNFEKKIKSDYEYITSQIRQGFTKSITLNT